MTNPDEPPKEQRPISEFLEKAGLPGDSDWGKVLSTDAGPKTLWAARFMDKVLFAVPRYIKTNWVEPNQQDYPYYHRRYRRVPTIDECYTHDYVCQFEADEQMVRDRDVEKNICVILQHRMLDCYQTNMQGFYERRDEADDPCRDLKNDYIRAQMNFYIKYGDMFHKHGARDVLMKQKHRLIWERRHGEYTMAGQAKKRAEEDAASGKLTAADL